MMTLEDTENAAGVLSQKESKALEILEQRPHLSAVESKIHALLLTKKQGFNLTPEEENFLKDNLH